jgi:hypothetical protein
MACLCQAGGERREHHGCVAKTPCSIAQELSTDVIVMRGSAELALGALEPDHPAVRDIGRIIASADEAAARVAELRHLACCPNDIGELGI